MPPPSLSEPNAWLVKNDMKRFYFAVMVLGLIIASFWPGLVMAQTSVATPSTMAQTINKSVELKNLFRSQLEQYQLAQREYSLYKQQYKQLQTLASLEKAVQATRVVLIRRSEVLTTYFDLLFDQLSTAPGIDVQKKQELSQQITALVEVLRGQKTQAESIVDKQAVADFADQFELLEPQILQTSYQTRAYLQVGAYQDLLVRSQAFSQEIKTYQATDSSSAFKQTARDRAYLETADQDQLVSQTLAVTLNSLSTGREYNQSWYNNLQEKLVGLQSGLERLYAFLLELTTY